MKYLKFLKRIFILVTILIIFQNSVYADSLNHAVVVEPATETIPNVSAERIVDRFIDIIQLYLLFISLLYISFFFIYSIKKKINFFKIKKSIDYKKLDKINFRKEISKVSRNNTECNKIQDTFILGNLSIIFLPFSFFCLVILIIRINIPLLSILLLIIYLILLVRYLFWIYSCFQKYMQSINDITKTVIYNKNDLQNKEYYFAKESLSNIKKTLPLFSILVLLSSLSAFLLEIVQNYAT